LLLHRILSKFEGNFFSSSGNLNGRCVKNELLNP
jgi:hypothetical protein